MFYYLCKRCNHITQQKIEMQRHLNKLNQCNIIDKFNEISEEDLNKLSLQKHEKLNEKNIKKDNFCKKCNKVFSNKGNLNKHLKNVCLNESNKTQYTTNIQNIGIQNIININLGMIKGFDQEWDTSKIDHAKKGEILLSNSKFTKTLENILKNDINLNVIIDQINDNTGVVYINENNKYEAMTRKEIIDRSMKKVYDHLKDFYNEIICNNKDDLSIVSLQNELKLFEKKYKDFLNFDDAKNIVNNSFSKLYNDKKESAENKYYNFIDNNDINDNLLDEY
jgi:hypothetical protein